MNNFVYVVFTEDDPYCGYGIIELTTLYRETAEKAVDNGVGEYVIRMKLDIPGVDPTYRYRPKES